MSPTDRPASLSRRFTVAVAVASLVGVGLGALLLDAARGGQQRARAERLAVVSLNALTAVVDRVWGSEDTKEGEGDFGLGDELAALEQPAETTKDPGAAIRGAVDSFAAAHSEAVAIRVVALDGARLVASTADRAAPAPRRLSVDEKAIFDLAQSLRAAVAGNREGAEGAARAEEIAVERRGGGLLSVAGPVERHGVVVGMVQMETRPAAAKGVFAWLVTLLALIGPTLVFLLLSRVAGERRRALALVGAALVIAALALFGRTALGTLSAERFATEEAVAARVAEEGAKTGLSPAAWDVDRFRQPQPAPEAAEERDLRRMTRSVLTLSVFALLLLAYVGFGGARRSWRAMVDYHVAYAYVTPAILGMLVLVFFPFLYGFALSFTNANLYNSDQSVFDLWVGLDNFIDILSDFKFAQRTPEGVVYDYTNFYWTLGFTVVWTITNVSIGVSLGLILALILNQRGFRGKAFYRVLLILPWATPTYITALVWRGMFHQQFGVVNQIVQIFGHAPIAWYDSPLTSFAAVLTTNGWLSFPFMMVISLGALQSIPGDLYEAARVDGAGRWQQFRSITLPSLRPALVPAVIISVIWTFNQFTVIYLVSAGQPAGATEILVTESYKLAFEQYRYGYAAAYSVIIFLFLLAYGTWQNKVTKGTEAIAG